MTPEADPVCKFADGCHRVATCNPGCGVPAVPVESERDRLHRQLVAVRAEADGWAEALTNADRLYTQHLAEIRSRVAALHHPVTLMGLVCCDECSTERSTGPRTSERIAYIPHPCRTIRALNGEAP